MKKLISIFLIIFVECNLFLFDSYSDSQKEKQVLKSAESSSTFDKSIDSSEKKPDTVESFCLKVEEYISIYKETGGSEDRWINLAFKNALEARKINKKSPMPQIAMAKAYMAKGEDQKAYDRLVQALELASEDAEVTKLAVEIMGKIKAQQGGLFVEGKGAESKKICRW